MAFCHLSLAEPQLHTPVCVILENISTFTEIPNCDAYQQWQSAFGYHVFHSRLLCVQPDVSNRKNNSWIILIHPDVSNWVTSGWDGMIHLEIYTDGNGSCKLQHEDVNLIHPHNVATDEFWLRLHSVAFVSILILSISLQLPDTNVYFWALSIYGWLF